MITVFIASHPILEELSFASGFLLSQMMNHNKKKLLKFWSTGLYVLKTFSTKKNIAFLKFPSGNSKTKRSVKSLKINP